MSLGAVAEDCPSDAYACGVDGFCHAPSGDLARPSAPVTFQSDDYRVTDIDHDGRGDVLGVSRTSIVVRYGDATGALSAGDSFVTPAQSGPASFGDLDGDGSIDITLATTEGLVTYTSAFGSLSPLDEDAILTSARKTGRVVVVHEASTFLGMGSEISALVTEQAFHHLEAPVLRVCGYNVPYPPSRIEEGFLPDLDRVLDAVDRSLAY